MEDPPRDKDVREYMTASAPSTASDAAIRRPEHLAFPLLQKAQEIELGGLSKGWYLVCGEAVRTDDNTVLERDCLWARIFEAREEGRDDSFGELLFQPKIHISWTTHKRHPQKRGEGGWPYSRHSTRA